MVTTLNGGYELAALDQHDFTLFKIAKGAKFIRRLQAYHCSRMILLKVVVMMSGVKIEIGLE